MHNSMHVLRRWGARQAGWLAALGLMAGAPLAQAGEYEHSPEVAAFIGEMTNGYGFAGEQLSSLFAQVERKQTILL